MVPVYAQLPVAIYIQLTVAIYVQLPVPIYTRLKPICKIIIGLYPLLRITG